MRDLSNDRSLLSINSMTVKPWSLEQLVEGCARAGISAISPWRDIVQACGLERAAKLIRTHGMTVTGLCRGGMFPAADAAGRRAALDDNRRAVDEAAAIGAQCLVLVVGGLPKGSRDIADALCISLKTVETHRTHINRKLGVHSPAELIRLAAIQGLLKSETARAYGSP